MACSKCQQEGHDKRSCKQKESLVSAPKIDAENDVKVEPPVKIEMNFDSQIRETLESHDHIFKKAHFDYLRSQHPKLKDFADEELEQIFRSNNSYSQSRRCKGGTQFEQLIENHLRDANISYSRQVPLDKDGCIAKSPKKNKVIDIVLGNPRVGEHISKYIVISLKKSTRERASEDDWTKHHIPKLYLYGTYSSDYPDSEKFEESDIRKILCVNPKKVDTRKFKLGFTHLYDLVHE